MLHVAQISFFLDPERRTPEQILIDWWPLVDCAEMVGLAGGHVTVIQACCESLSTTRGGVSYHFIAPDPAGSSIAASPVFIRLIERLNADIFHVHGMSFSRDGLALADLAPNTPIFLQDHADRVPRPWRRRFRRRGISVAAGVSFCALEQAKPFVAAAMIEPHTTIFEIPECSSRFTPGKQSAARRLTGIYGDPAVLWVGHLDTNKDPLTVLAGIRESSRHLPGLQLWCCFARAPLLSAVTRCVDEDSLLADRVHLLGRVPHGRIEQLMRAADLFVLGSHREGSGCSVIEALACGLSPVITDIPSFRMLTGGGAFGALWACGDAHALCGALLSVARHPRPERRSEVRAHFVKALSFESIGRQLTSAYRELLVPAIPTLAAISAISSPDARRRLL